MLAELSLVYRALIHFLLDDSEGFNQRFVRSSQRWR